MGRNREKGATSKGGRDWCRQCRLNGDAIQFLRDYRKLDYHRACQVLSVKAEGKANPVKAAAAASPPENAWQQGARRFVEARRKTLWGEFGKDPLDWLRKRGLKDQTITDAGLGYNLLDENQDRAEWGLNYEEGRKTVWLSEGVVIPFEIFGHLWKLQIRSYRSLEGRQKYYCIKGSKNGLYGADKITAGKPVILVEGAFDALSLMQQAGDLITPVAPGSTTGGRMDPWIGLLTSAPFVLVSFDADEGGDAATRHWIKKLPNSVGWRPFWDDPSQMLMDGADLRSWVQQGIEYAMR